jgi:hypothetical protein
MEAATVGVEPARSPRAHLPVAGTLLPSLLKAIKRTPDAALCSTAAVL